MTDAELNELEEAVDGRNPNITKLIAAIRERDELIRDLAAPNKMSETERTLLVRFHCLRNQAKEMLGAK